MDLDVSDVEELFHLLDDGGDAWMMSLMDLWMGFKTVQG